MAKVALDCKSGAGDRLIESMISRPVHRQLYEYWQEIRNGKKMPSRADFDPVDVRFALPKLFMFDVLQNPLDFRYRLIGTEVVANLTQDYTGKRLSELPGKGPGSLIWAHYSNIVENRRPSINSVPYVGPHKDFKKVSMLTLPFSDDEETVNIIIAISEFVYKS